MDMPKFSTNSPGSGVIALVSGRQLVVRSRLLRRAFELPAGVLATPPSRLPTRRAAPPQRISDKATARELTLALAGRADLSAAWLHTSELATLGAVRTFFERAGASEAQARSAPSGRAR